MLEGFPYVQSLDLARLAFIAARQKANHRGPSPFAGLQVVFGDVKIVRLSCVGLSVVARLYRVDSRLRRAIGSRRLTAQPESLREPMGRTLGEPPSKARDCRLPMIEI